MTGNSQQSTKDSLSVVLPVRDERGEVEAQLAHLRELGGERIWVDGGSTDGTVERLREVGETIVESEPGRGTQLARGVEVATGDRLLFLHVDTRLPAAALALVSAAIEGGAAWGAFRLSYPGRPSIRVVAATANLRSRFLALPFGDQALFCTRAAYLASGGFRSIPIMEDVDLARRLRRAAGRPAILAAAVAASPRRFDRRGVVRTVLLDWKCQLGWALGVAPERIRSWYAGASTGSGSPRDP